MKNRSSFLAIAMVQAAVLVLLLGPGHAAALDAKVHFSAEVEPATLRAEEYGTLSIEAVVPTGYHLYSMTRIPDGPLPLKVSVTNDAFEAVGNWYGPKPKVERDPNFNKDVEYYEGTVSHQLAFRVKAGTTAQLPVELKLRGQICDESKCIPLTQKISLTVPIEAGSARGSHDSAPKLAGIEFTAQRTPSAESTSTSSLPLGEGLLGFLIIAFLAGLGALVTPCVFPMIPITISFFSKFAQVSMRRSVTMATIYAVSIIGTFTAIGVLVSAIFGAVGMQALSASPWFNLFLTALLVFFAFNLWGLFEIQIPNWLVSKSSQKEHEFTSDDGSLAHQAAGVFFMAITFTLVSFTCTVGFIGVVLAAAAKGNYLYPTFGMLAFALAFSLPFFLLAVFPAWADKLRGRGGDWMVAVKVILGFIEFAGAFKFLSNVDLVWRWEIVSRPLVLAFWVAIFFLAGLYLLRTFYLPHSDTDVKTISPIRMFFAMAMFALAAYSATGIRDTKSMGGWLDGWLPPSLYPGSIESSDADHSGHLPWIVDDIDKGFARAKEENKPLFIDFTGYTCTNCRYMEGSVFPKPSVRSRLEQMVLVTAYTDAESEVAEQQRAYQIERFETAALPFYAILNPHDDTVLATFASMTNDTSEFAAFLEKGIGAFQQVAKKKEPKEEHVPTADAGKFADVSVELTLEGPPVDFEYTELLSDKKWSLSSSRGKWIFVNLWASWCAPCVEEIKHDFPQVFTSNNAVQLVTIAFDDEDTVEAARKLAGETIVKDHTALFANTTDTTEAGFSELFEVTENLPISYLIHPGGHIAWSQKASVDAPLLERLFGEIPK